MKSFVITIEDIPESVAAAERCIASMPEFNVQKFKAVTPKNDPKRMLKERGINPDWFLSVDNGRYSKLLRCMAAFLSHHTLWEMCVADNVEYQIFEHDAVRVGNLPQVINHRGTLNIGAPSYGTFQTPKNIGLNSLVSKPYFPGAHAYRMKPNAARAIVNHARDMACATDVFLNKENFPWLEEYYPWPVIAKDNFSTIQNQGGCHAKHGYNKATYKIL